METLLTELTPKEKENIYGGEEYVWEWQDGKLIKIIINA